MSTRTPALGPLEQSGAARPAPPPGDSHGVPANALALVWAIRRDLLPATRSHLGRWLGRAAAIPDETLRLVATESLRSRRFHSEGLASYALLAAPAQRAHVLRFTVAFQTMVDYLDGVADRLTALDGRAIRRLHDALLDAVAGASRRRTYYPAALDGGDGGYLESLVRECRRTLAELPSYADHASGVLLLVRRYAECQAYKRLATEEALRGWALREARDRGLEWYEFAAAANSTLTVHCLAALASLPLDGTTLSARVLHAYFPSVQVLGVLFDNLIDRAEDRAEGHLNFCAYYPSEERLLERLAGFFDAAMSAVAGLPNAAFHRLIIRGHVGLYRWDPKVAGLDGARRLLGALTPQQTLATWVLSWMGWYLRRKRRRGDHD